VCRTEVQIIGNCIFMPLLAFCLLMMHCFNAVFILCGDDHILTVCEHSILQTACTTLTKFSRYVQLGTKKNCLDWEVESSNIKVTSYKTNWRASSMNQISQIIWFL